MPTYEYKCNSCKNIKEEFQYINDPAPLCDKCKIEMTKLINGAPMIRKGAGLYSLDIDLKPSKLGE